MGMAMVMGQDESTIIRSEPNIIWRGQFGLSNIRLQNLLIITNALNPSNLVHHTSFKLFVMEMAMEMVIQMAMANMLTYTSLLDEVFDHISPRQGAVCTVIYCNLERIVSE